MMACKGDEVFFHHNQQPKVGKVLSAGKHGCVVEHEGTRHKLKWQHLAGHKSRVPQNYKVMEEGEDGLIVADERGGRRLVRIPPEAKAEQLALDPQAVPSKGRPKYPGA